MKSIAARPVFAALLTCAAIVAACGGSQWRELEVSEGAFSVLMRGQAHYARQDLNGPGGRMTAHLYSSDRPDSYFAVGYVDYPLVMVSGAAPQQLFSGVRDTWVRKIHGKLVASDSTLKLAGKYPGLEFLAEGTSAPASSASQKDAPAKPVATFIQARLYLVDQRLYQVIAMGRKGEVPQGEVNRYLNSFRLVQQAEVGSLKIDPQQGK